MSKDQSLVFIIDDDPSMHASIELDRGRRAESMMLAELWQRFDSLTSREREVMALVAAGRLNEQIAAELDLSEITARFLAAS